MIFECFPESSLMCFIGSVIDHDDIIETGGCHAVDYHIQIFVRIQRRNYSSYIIHIFSLKRQRAQFCALRKILVDDTRLELATSRV